MRIVGIHVFAGEELYPRKFHVNTHTCLLQVVKCVSLRPRGVRLSGDGLLPRLGSNTERPLFILIFSI